MNEQESNIRHPLLRRRANQLLKQESDRRTLWKGK